MNCMKCRYALHAGQKYCPRCGTKVSTPVQIEQAQWNEFRQDNNAAKHKKQNKMTIYIIVLLVCIFFSIIGVTILAVIFNSRQKSHEIPLHTESEYFEETVAPTNAYIHEIPIHTEAEIFEETVAPTNAYIAVPDTTESIPRESAQPDFFIPIYYDANGGEDAPTVPAGRVYNHEMMITHPETVPSRQGYTFVGWVYENMNDAEIDQPGQTVYYGELYWDDPITYYARWEKNTSPSAKNTESNSGNEQWQDPSTESRSAADYVSNNASSLTIRDMFDSLPGMYPSERENAYYNTHGSDYEGTIGKRDIDADGIPDEISRTAVEYEGHYEIRFGNGNKLKIEATDIGATTYLVFYFEDLNGTGKDDIVVCHTTITTAGVYRECAAIYLDAPSSNGSYHLVPLPTVSLEMTDYGNGMVQISCLEKSISEVQILGSQQPDLDFEACYGTGMDSQGCVKAYGVRDVIACDNSIIVYYDFGIYSKGHTQPMGVKLYHSNTTDRFEIKAVGSDLIREYWLIR